MIKNPPANAEMQIQSLSWEELLEQEMAITPGFLPGKFHGQRGLEGFSPWGCKELDMTEQLSTHSISYVRILHFVYPVIRQQMFELFPSLATVNNAFVDIAFLVPCFPFFGDIIESSNC